MFGRRKKPQDAVPSERSNDTAAATGAVNGAAHQPVHRQATTASPRPSRRHGRRGIRSSLTGAHLPNPESRTSKFEADARGAVQLLQHHLREELAGVHIGFATAPMGQSDSEQPLYYSINRANRTIIMYRMPIQRAKGLHVDDADHRRFFVEHCVHRAVCEYLGRSPWEVLPGRFDHF